MRGWGRRARAAWASVPAPVRRGWILGFVAVFGVIAVGSVLLPPPGSADTYWHLDYTYQLAHGHLPDAVGGEYAYHGSDTPPFGETSLHFAAAHPPLLYALSVPILGPLFPVASLFVVTTAARAIVMLIGAVLFVALARFGWLFGGRLRNQFSVGLPAVGMMLVPIAHFAGDYYNDILVTTLSVLLITEIALVLRDGMSRTRLMSMTVFAALGMASKATFATTYALMIGIVAVVVWRAASGGAWRRLGAVMRPMTVLTVVPFVFIGWFYLWNWSRSGSPVRSYAKVPIGSRPYKSAGDVLTSDTFYTKFFDGWLGTRRWTLGPLTNYTTAAVVVLVAILLVGLWWWRMRPSKFSATLVLLLGAHVVLLYGTQFSHAVGYGQLNWRYFMAGMLALACALTLAALSLGKRTGALVLSAGVAVLAFIGLYDRLIYLDRKFSTGAESDVVGIDLVRWMASQGNVPLWPMYVTLAVAAVSLVGFGVALWRTPSLTPRALQDA